MSRYPSLQGVLEAADRLEGLTRLTPLEKNKRLSVLTGASVFF